MKAPSEATSTSSPTTSVVAVKPNDPSARSAARVVSRLASTLTLPST